ncbi:nuclease [Ciceribacter sp. L1K22]|uniref:nuclease n=1 Tax=Ciceribacter sp. L1K22 TaxID=2820275 RepID=UPI001ABE49CC|nr:nuclease [Ciceribacter sp. L1K22]MBO3760139.1 nuclease [Ciceribacter sp. L1K22]
MARSAQSRRSKPRSRRKTAPVRSGGGLWSWILILGVVAGGIAAYERRDQLPREIASLLPAPERTDRVGEKPKRQAAERTTPKPPKPVQKSTDVARRSERPIPKPLARPDDITTAAVTPPAPIPAVPVGKPGATVEKASLPQGGLTGKGHSGRFYFCGTSGLDSCVARGDTFWYHKSRVTLADIVAPATEGARCQQERDLGFAAQVRLRELLNAGSFELAAAGEGSHRIVSRNGKSLGAVLVAEGLARPRGSAARSWCP